MELDPPSTTSGPGLPAQAGHPDAGGKVLSGLAMQEPVQRAATAARKVPAAVYRVTKSREPYPEGNPELSKRKNERLDGKGETPTDEVRSEDPKETVVRLRNYGKAVEGLTEVAQEVLATRNRKARGVSGGAR